MNINPNPDLEIYFLDSCVSRNPELLNIGISKIVSKSGFGIKMKINIKIKKIEDLN
jgi:hypothetical protein